MRALVFCDDLYHPAATVRAGLAPLAELGLAFDWVEDATDWAVEELDRYAVAVLSKSNVRSYADRTPWLHGADRGVFARFVSRGGGLVAIHSGLASYQEVPEVRGVLGGVFVTHPPPGDVEVRVRPGHPVSQGVAASFSLHDEHYQMQLDDAGADVFLHARSAHGIQPAGWTRQVGAGRVCVLTPGHFPEVWLHPEYQRLLRNALAWVAPAAR